MADTNEFLLQQQFRGAKLPLLDSRLSSMLAKDDRNDAFDQLAHVTQNCFAPSPPMADRGRLDTIEGQLIAMESLQPLGVASPHDTVPLCIHWGR